MELGTRPAAGTFAAWDGQERVMADNSGNAFLGFIVGGLVVVVALLGFVLYSGNFRSGDTVRVELPKPTITK
jgi:hypothetical protein